MASLILIFIIGAIVAVNVMPRLRELRSIQDRREDFWGPGDAEHDEVDIFSSPPQDEKRQATRRRNPYVEINEDSPAWPGYARSLNL